MIDEYPVLFVAAALAEGRTVARGAHELRVKESDRIAAMAAALGACGVAVEEFDDGLAITGTGGEPIPGGATIASLLDHRIAMAMTVAGLARHGADHDRRRRAGRDELPELLRHARWAARGMIDRRMFLAGGAALAASLALPRSLFARQPDGYPPPDLEKMVPVEGGRVYVRVNGAIKGPKLPIVMLHGGPGGTHAHFLTALALADERAVILYDQLDSGQSDRPNDPKNWRVSRFVDEIELVRRALGVERWHLLGHSWGGTLALEYGARQPAALRGLAMASPLVSTRSWIADANLLRTQLPADVQARIATCDAAPGPVCDAGTNAFYRAFNGREPATMAASIYARAHPGGFNPKLYNAMWGAQRIRLDRLVARL